MSYGIRKGLEDIAYELKGIRNILSSIWSLQKGENEFGSANPEAYADEYISTEECARRLGVSDQTIRNWIVLGKSTKKKAGWIEGIHYVNINPGANRKNKIRIPWNNLVRSFSKNPKLLDKDYKEKGGEPYRINEHSIDAYLSSIEEKTDAEEKDTFGPSV